MRRLVAILALLLCALPVRATEPPLALSLSLSRDEVRPDIAGMARTSLTIAVFSASAITTTVRLSLTLDVTRVQVVSVTPSAGRIAVLDMYPPGSPPPNVRWDVEVQQGMPALLVLTFEAKPDAPIGLATFGATAQDDAGNHVSAESAVRVGPVAWAAPARPTLRLYLPVLRR